MITKLGYVCRVITTVNSEQNNPKCIPFGIAALSCYLPDHTVLRAGRCSRFVLKKGGNFISRGKDELLTVLVGDQELGREEYPISEAGVPQLRFHHEVSCSFLRDLDAVVRVDVYFGSTEGKGAGFSSKLQDMFLGPVVVDSRDERVRRVVLLLTGDGESVSPVHGWRSD